MPAMPTLNLTERTSQIVRLSRETLAFLLERHRAHLTILPMASLPRQREEGSSYHLRPRGVVGVIVTPDCRLVISPKIPLRSLFFMLAPEQATGITEQAVLPASGVLDFLAAQLAVLMRQRVQAGLHREYLEQAEQCRYLHGRLDVAEQLRQGPAHKEILHSRFDELTADLPCNRIPRALAERLLNVPELDATVATMLRQALHSWGGIEDREDGSILNPWHRLFETSPPEYQPLLEVCRLLWEGLAPGLSAGLTAAPTFLLDMERVFERYLTHGLVQIFTKVGWRTEVQHDRVVSEREPGPLAVSMRPDLFVSDQVQPLFVVDAKWKRLRQGCPETVDLYQMLAYCSALEVERAALVYPGRNDREWNYHIRGTGVTVSVYTLCVTAAPARCRRSMRRLGRMLRRGKRE